MIVGGQSPVATRSRAGSSGAGGCVRSVEQIVVQQLGARPAIRAYVEPLQLKERVEAVAPVRELAHLTNGEEVVARVANRLTAPRPLDDIIQWAEDWAVAETFGIAPAALNDDRLGRCLDDLAAVHDRPRGELTVQAIAAFGLATKTVRWDLPSVLVSGEHPPEEQVAGYAQARSGSSSGRQKQVRSLQVTTDDGAVPIWDRVHDGNTTAVATVIETLPALREHARCTDCVLVGHSTLLSETNRRALLAAEVGSLAPLARRPELEAAFLAIPPEAPRPLEHRSARDAARPPDELATDHGDAEALEAGVPDANGGQRRQRLQRLFVRRSQEQAACRRNRARQRERAAAAIAGLLGRVGSRWSPTAERARATIEAILDRRRLTDLDRVRCDQADGRPPVSCAVVPAALVRAEALDGSDVLETTRSAAEASPRALLAEWKGQWQIEQRQLCRRSTGPSFSSSTCRRLPMPVSSRRSFDSAMCEIQAWRPWRPRC